MAMLSSPRIRHVDLSYLDESTGTTLLHEAARRKDLRLVELAVRAGADVFARDRKGRAVGDGLPKDDKVRVFLRQCECGIILYPFALATNTLSSQQPRYDSVGPVVY